MSARLPSLGPWEPVARGPGLATVIGLVLLALWMATADQGWLSILDGANLLFHEAGHPIFGIFGATMALYGGTLGQLVFPTVTAATGVMRRQVVMTAVGVGWFGQNLGNIARYVADARAQELPLVGGGEHDWTTIRSRWHALSADHRVAGVFRTLGYGLVLGAAAWTGWRLWRDRDENP